MRLSLGLSGERSYFGDAFVHATEFKHDELFAILSCPLLAKNTGPRDVALTTTAATSHKGNVRRIKELDRRTSVIRLHVV